MKLNRTYTTIAAVVLVLTAAASVPLLKSHYRPTAAAISMPYTTTFHGDGFTLAGTITADCPCDIQAWLDEQELTLDDAGNFNGQIVVKKGANTGKFTVTAHVKGKKLNAQVIESKTEGSYTREQTPCRLSGVPEEWGEPTISFDVVCPTAENMSTTLEGIATKETFNNAFDNQWVTLPVQIRTDGYATHTQHVTIKNTKYDSKRVAAVKAKEDAERKLAEAKRAKEQEAERKRQAEIAQKEQLQKENEAYMNSPKGQRDLFLLTLRASGIDESLIEGVEEGYVKNSIRIIVSNSWHLAPYQVRLQAAQNLQNLWAAAIPDDAVAMISIVDYNGNEVGGRGVFGVWVQKD